MKKITNFLFSFSLVRVLFINCLFIKANNNYYVFYLKLGWEYSKRFKKIRFGKMNMQEIYLPSGKQETQIIRCVNEKCKSILNMHNGSYTVTYAGNMSINEYDCSCCGQKQWFISDEINGTVYYINCTPEESSEKTISSNVFINNHKFPEKKSVLVKSAY